MESLCLCPDTGDPRRATRVRSFFVALAWRHSAVHMPRSKQDGRLSCRKEGSRGTGDNGGRWGKGGRIQAVGGRPVPTRIREHSKIITRARGAGRVILGHPRDKSTPPLLSLSPDHRPFQPPFSNSLQHPSPFPSEEYGSLIRFLPLAQPPVHLPPPPRQPTFPNTTVSSKDRGKFRKLRRDEIFARISCGRSIDASISIEGRKGWTERPRKRSLASCFPQTPSLPRCFLLLLLLLSPGEMENRERRRNRARNNVDRRGFRKGKKKREKEKRKKERRAQDRF